MNQDNIIIRCNNCGFKNRIPRIRLREGPICGKCRTPLEVESHHAAYGRNSLKR